jgi:lincosamide nucleotidyltransferase A/C/D/E
MLLPDIFEVFDQLEEAQVCYWVGGGWGVDALVGSVTREHRDLDLAVDARQLQQCLDLLRESGYEVETDWLPIRVELASERGWVDIHPLEIDEAGNGVQAGPDGSTFDYPVEALQHGSLTGRRIPCLSVELQLEFHTGYEPRPADLHDLDLLRSLVR